MTTISISTMADGDNYTSAMYYSDAQICIRQILNARIGIDEDQFNHYYSFAKDEARQLLGSHGDADAVEYMTLAWTWMYFCKSLVVLRSNHVSTAKRPRSGKTVFRWVSYS